MGTAALGRAGASVLWESGKRVPAALCVGRGSRKSRRLGIVAIVGLANTWRSFLFLENCCVKYSYVKRGLRLVF